MLKKITLFVFISLLLNATNSFAAWPHTEQDYSLLPPFCWARSHPGSPEEQLWKKRLDSHGEGFVHVHHYCEALHSLRLAQQMLPTNDDEKITNNIFLTNNHEAFTF